MYCHCKLSASQSVYSSVSDVDVYVVANGRNELALVPVALITYVLITFRTIILQFLRQSLLDLDRDCGDPTLPELHATRYHFFKQLGLEHNKPSL